MASNVEVLRDWLLAARSELAAARGEVQIGRWRERVEALSDAIKAVEREQVLAVQERFRPAMQRWEELAKDDGLALCLGEDDAEDLRTVLALAEESMHRREAPVEAQPKVEGRPDDLVVADWCQLALPDAPEPEGAKIEEEIWRARASEAALSERVAALEAIERSADALVKSQLDVLRHGRASRELVDLERELRTRPPSKPETP